MRQMASSASASVSAILAVAAALVSAASATTEECRGVKVIQKIDMSMLRGVWYESHSMNLLSVAGPRQCHAAHFYPASDGNSFTILHDYVYYVGEQVLSGSRFGWNVTDEDPANDGHFAVEMALYFSEWIKATFVVMDTDYNNFAIIYVCQFTGDQVNLNGGMILTRKKLLDDDDSKFILSRIDDSYKRNFMSKSEFIPTMQNDCKEVFFPEYFPSNVYIGTPPAEVLFMPLDDAKPVTHHEHHVEPPPPAQPVEQPPPSTRLHQESPASFMPVNNNDQNLGPQDNSKVGSGVSPVGSGGSPVGSGASPVGSGASPVGSGASPVGSGSSPVGSGASTNVASETPKPTTSANPSSVTQVSSTTKPGFADGFMANLIAALGAQAGIWPKPKPTTTSSSSSSSSSISSVSSWAMGPWTSGSSYSRPWSSQTSSYSPSANAWSSSSTSYQGSNFNSRPNSFFSSDLF